MFNERMDVSEYAGLAEQFDAKGFNPRAWARTAKEAGMKYMVLTTKHHDGFCLFDSKVSSFNSVNSAAGRDLVAEFAEACRAEGLKVGLYYSPMDWRFPGYFFPEMYMESALQMKEQCWGHIRELMTGYGKIDLLWYDGEWLAHGGINWEVENGWYRSDDFAKDDIYFKVNYFWESEKLNAMVRELQPGIKINNRSGWKGDFHVRERRIGGMRTDKPWDSNDCLTQSWGYIPNVPMLTLQECIRYLLNTVTRDGNYLLNVGPMGDGAIEDRQIALLRQAGDWLKLYGYTMYKTRGGPFIPGEWGGATYSQNIVYLHITDWPSDKLVLPKLSQSITAWKNITSNNAFVEETETAIEISVPVEGRDSIDTIIALHFEDPITWEGVTEVEQDAYGLADGL